MRSQRTTKAGTLFFMSLGLYLWSFVLPFLGEETGINFFLEGIELLFRGKIRKHDHLLFAAFYLPFLCFPLLIAAWWKQQGSLFRTGWMSVGVLIIPQFIIGYEITQRLRTIAEINYIGYVTWCLAALLLTAAIFYKKEGQELAEDLSKHLIGEEP